MIKALENKEKVNRILMNTLKEILKRFYVFDNPNVRVTFKRLMREFAYRITRFIGLNYHDLFFVFIDVIY